MLVETQVCISHVHVHGTGLLFYLVLPLLLSCVRFFNNTSILFCYGHNSRYGPCIVWELFTIDNNYNVFISLEVIVSFTNIILSFTFLVRSFYRIYETNVDTLLIQKNTYFWVSFLLMYFRRNNTTIVSNGKIQKFYRNYNIVIFQFFFIYLSSSLELNGNFYSFSKDSWVGFCSTETISSQFCTIEWC